jgi:hypothetical protein
MVHIIEHREDAPSDENVLELKVYLSGKDGKTVLGHTPPFATLGKSLAGKQPATWELIPFGVSVDDAFRTALGMCERDGVSTLWVHDPDNLFPPHMRPTAPLDQSA